MKKQSLKAIIKHNNTEDLDDLVDEADREDSVRTRNLRNSKPKSKEYELTKKQHEKARAAQRKLKKEAQEPDDE